MNPLPGLCSRRRREVRNEHHHPRKCDVHRAAASYSGCSEATLRLWRTLAKGPRKFKAGKLVRYHRCRFRYVEEALLSTSIPLERWAKGASIQAPTLGEELNESQGYIWRAKQKAAPA